jgi:hypothetical protein
LKWHSIAAALALVATTALAADVPAGASSRSAAVAEARAALILMSYFPAGWTTSPSDNSNSTLGDAQVAACLGVPVAVINYSPPSAYSPDFNHNSTAVSASDQVSVFPNEKTAKQEFDLFSSARTPVCFAKTINSPSIKRAFEKQIGTGTKIGEASAAWLPRPAVGDSATALELNFPFTYRGDSFHLTITIVTMISKLVAAQLTFTAAGSTPFPSSLAAHLESVTAQRLP